MDDEVKDLGTLVHHRQQTGLLAEAGSTSVNEELHIISLEISALDTELKHCAATVAELLSTLIMQAKALITPPTTTTTAVATILDTLEPSASEVDSETSSTTATPVCTAMDSDATTPACTLTPQAPPAPVPPPSSGEQIELQLFPTQCQRRLYLQALQWNDRIILVGQMIMALKNQLQTSDSKPPSEWGGGKPRAYQMVVE